MKREKSRLTGAVLLAIVVHVLFVGMLVLSFDWTPRPVAPSGAAKVIKATTVDESQVRREMAHIKQAKQQHQAREQAQLQAAKDKAAREQRRAEELKQQRATALAQQKKAEQAKQAALERQKQAAARAAELQRQETQKRLAAQQRKEAEAKRLVEEKRKQEEAKRLAALKAKQEAERKRQEDEARRIKEAEQSMQQQLAAEQEQRNVSIMQQYLGLIREKVTRNWVRPSGWQAGQSCKLDIQLMPGGDVVNAQTVTSCGSPMFDQSVVAAVNRAAPLPLPPNGELFDRFRDITFIFNPKD